MERCDGCGFVYELDRAPEAAAHILDGSRHLAEMLVAPAADVRSRRQPELWSPLEYCCHVRDVLLVQRERVLAARRQVRPSFEPMGRDERVEHDGYGQQDPGDVARQLTDAAHLFVGVLRRLPPEEWERTVYYNYPAHMERSLRWVAVHTEHEIRHHRGDVEQQLS